MLRVLRQILLALVAVAFVGGTTADLARAAETGPFMATMDAPCCMGMPMSASGGDAKPMTPCKGLTADCIKQMACVTIDALPAHFTADVSAVQYAMIDYWSPLSELVSLDHQPEPQPPRTA